MLAVEKRECALIWHLENSKGEIIDFCSNASSGVGRAPNLPAACGPATGQQRELFLRSAKITLHEMRGRLLGQGAAVAAA